MLFGNVKPLIERLNQIDKKLDTAVVVAPASPMSSTELTEYLYGRAKERSGSNKTSRQEVRDIVADLRALTSSWTEPERFAFIRELGR